MPLPKNLQPFAISARCGVGQSGINIISGFAAPLFLVIKYIEIMITIAGAQDINIRNTGGSVWFGVIPANAPEGSIFRFGPYVNGIVLPPATTILGNQAGAGPAWEAKAIAFFDGHKAT